MTVYKSIAVPVEAAWRTAPRRRPLAFTRHEWLRLGGLYGFIALLHLCGWGLFLHYTTLYPTLAGLGFVAYTFGLRHALDADHIAAVDDTVRYMLQKGRRPLGVGFFFSLGHSTVVLELALGDVFAAAAVKHHLPELRNAGGLIGTGVSGLFLWVVGILNLVVLLDISRAWGETRTGKHSHAHVDELLRQRGFLNRLFGGRLQRIINHSWQMYPLGLLFGLGFDTASEIGVLAMTAGASAGDIPVAAVLCLPILFAAGMTALDTTDGVLMVKAYDWALVNPLRKIYYNLVITGLSVVVALAIGTIELLQVSIRVLGLAGPFVDRVVAVDFGMFGYVIVGVLLAAWCLSAAIWKFGRIEERFGPDRSIHAHVHAHENGVSHSHTHFH